MYADFSVAMWLCCCNEAETAATATHTLSFLRRNSPPVETEISVQDNRTTRVDAARESASAAALAAACPDCQPDRGWER